METFKAVFTLFVFLSICLGLLAAGIYFLYLEYVIHCKGFYTKGEVVRLRRISYKSEVAIFYSSLAPIIRFKNQEGNIQQRRPEGAIHSSFFLPSEGDVISVIFYDDKLYRYNFNRTPVGLFWLSLGIYLLMKILEIVFN